MREADPIELQLRYRIIGLLHTGRLQPGDRLPSIRTISREMAVDHRVVADAYRALEREGVVEIRPGSGVYAAARQEIGGISSDRVRWLGRVFHEGWLRQMSPADVADLVSRSTSRKIQCGVVESNKDHMVALCAEMEDGFSLAAKGVMVNLGSGTRGLARRLKGVELIVTSIFHADLAREVGGHMEIPIVVVTIHPDFVAEINRRLNGSPLTVVMVDAEYASRGKRFLGVTAHRDRTRFVLVSEFGGDQSDLEREDVLLTRAARRQLGMSDYHLIEPPPGLISSESASDLMMEIARISVARR
ncbi:MAG TPA: GntR family transcriptional regulator [Longimicrobiaceae bacterium]|nr:GntR family transcriptional regulator [Longimicrobiaceae bacterium]